MITINIWFLPYLHLADNFVFFILEIWYSLHEIQICIKKKKEPEKNLWLNKGEFTRQERRERGRQSEKEREILNVNDERQTNITPLSGKWLISQKINLNKKKWSMKWVCNYNYILGFHQKTLLNSSKVN